MDNIKEKLKELILEIEKNSSVQSWTKAWSIEAKALLETHPDPSKIWPQFAIFLMLDETQCAGRHPQCNIVARTYQDELDGKIGNWQSLMISAHDAWSGTDNCYPLFSCIKWTCWNNIIGASRYAIKYAGENAILNAHADFGNIDDANDYAIYERFRTKQVSWHDQAAKLLELLRESS